VHLGANACIIGRNVDKTESMARDLATARQGARVIGIGAVDVRQPQALQAAAERCVRELGGIDFVMYVCVLLAEILLHLSHYMRYASDFGSCVYVCVCVFTLLTALLDTGYVVQVQQAIFWRRWISCLQMHSRA
jgi:hypothetical protein